MSESLDVMDSLCKMKKIGSAVFQASVHQSASMRRHFFCAYITACIISFLPWPTVHRCSLDIVFASGVPAYILPSVCAHMCIKRYYICLMRENITENYTSLILVDVFDADFAITAQFI